MVRHSPGVRLPASHTSCFRPKICSSVLIKPLCFINFILQSFSILFGLTRSYMPMVHPYFHAWSAIPSQEGTTQRCASGCVCLRTWTPSACIFLLTGVGAPPAQGFSLLLVRCQPYGRGVDAVSQGLHSRGPCPWTGFQVDLRRGLPALRTATHSLFPKCPGHKESVPQPALWWWGMSGRAQWLGETRRRWGGSESGYRELHVTGPVPQCWAKKARR